MTADPFPTTALPTPKESGVTAPGFPPLRLAAFPVKALADSSHPCVDGSDIRSFQGVSCHRVLTTATIHTHVLNRGGRGVRSPNGHAV